MEGGRGPQSLGVPPWAFGILGALEAPGGPLGFPRGAQGPPGAPRGPSGWAKGPPGLPQRAHSALEALQGRGREVGDSWEGPQGSRGEPTVLLRTSGDGGGGTRTASLHIIFAGIFARSTVCHTILFNLDKSSSIAYHDSSADADDGI